MPTLAVSDGVIAGSFTLGGVVLGAALTLIVVLVTSAIEARRTRRAAARLLSEELLENLALITLFLRSRRAVPPVLKDDVWKSVRPTIAAHLSEEDLIAVARCYVGMTLERWALAALFLLAPLTPILRLVRRGWYETFEGKPQEIIAARAILDKYC